MYTEPQQHDYETTPEEFMTALWETVATNERNSKEVKKLNEGWRTSDGHTSVAIVPRSHDQKQTWCLYVKLATFDGFTITFRGKRNYEYGEVEPKAYQLSRKIANSPTGMADLIGFLQRKATVVDASYNDDF